MPNQILDQINARAESSGRGMPLMNENNNIQQQVYKITLKSVRILNFRYSPILWMIILCRIREHKDISLRNLPQNF
jgi:predicted butyrate kinase (DUF1464 family)